MERAAGSPSGGTQVIRTTVQAEGFAVLPGVRRVVPFSGVLRQTTEASDEVIGAGHFLLPEAGEVRSGELLFLRKEVGMSVCGAGWLLRGRSCRSRHGWRGASW